MTITGIISAILIGIVVGVLGRLVVPGKQNISMVVTILVGIVAAFVGTAIARAMGIPTATSGVDWLELLVQVIVAALGVASPSADRVSAACLAAHVRGQWAIESLHWLRDTLYQEDKSQVRTRSGPRIMAALRNLAICALRLAGRADVTEATRWASRSMDRPFAILGLSS